MNDINWIDLLSVITTTTVLDFGAPLLALALFLAGLGLPIPATALVLGAGALAQQGILNGPGALLLGLSGVVLGDTLSYALGRFAAPRIPARLTHGRTWQKASHAFEGQAVWLVYLSRWLLTPLALPVNLLAGSSGLSFWRFLSSDAAGELTWLALYGGLGYFLGSQWTTVTDYLSTFSHWLIVLLAGLALAYLLRGRRAHALAA